ncbi:MAG: DUF2157 domain-containing protein [Cyanobacteria bacterium J06581_3]
MRKEDFRRRLRDESARWREEGLIGNPLYEQLAERYQFDAIDSDSSSRFISVLLGLGGILLGLGAITLVAANWQVWPRSLRMVIIFSAFVATNTTGFYLWRRPQDQPGLQRLGHGLLLTGSLLLGANLALMSQMFHQGGSLSSLYLVWGLGTLAMAYGLRLTSLGFLSCLLLGMSHWEVFIGSRSWDWAGGDSWVQMLQIYLPLLVTPLYLPLAHQLRSRLIYAMWGIGLIAMLLTPGSALVHWQGSWWTLVMVLIPALLWVYHRQFWTWPNVQMAALSAEVSATRSPLYQRLGADGPVEIDETGRGPFQSVGQSLAIWFMSIALYIYSFEGVWYPYGSAEDYSGSMARSFGLAIGVLWAIALYGVWQWWLRSRRRPEPKSLWMRTPVFLGLLALMGIAVFCHSQGAALFVEGSTLATAWAVASIVGLILINLMLFFVGFAMVHDGMSAGIRHRFWGGMGIVVISLMTRVFEYDTGLTLKALVLAICGVVVIVAGLWFEKKMPHNTQATTTEMENT